MKKGFPACGGAFLQLMAGFAVLPRRDAGFPFEQPDEVVGIAETALHADILYRCFGGEKQFLGLGDPVKHNVFLGAASDRLRETMRHIAGV